MTSKESPVVLAYHSEGEKLYMLVLSPKGSVDQVCNKRSKIVLDNNFNVATMEDV